jgi:hypothetical protein
MSSLEIGLIILFTIFSGAVLGMLIGAFLPEHHLSGETKSAISVSMAVVGTLTALVLGLLISNASSSFSTRNSEVTRISADMVRMDRLLRRYGPEADGARKALQRYLAMKFDDLFPETTERKPNLDNPATVEMLEHVQDMMLALKPSDDRQHWLITQALQLAAEASETRWLLFEQNATSLPVPFLIVVVFWLTILLASFGLFAPRNATVTVALLLCSLAASGGIAMILEMNDPFGGIVRISSVPMRHAVEVINH